MGTMLWTAPHDLDDIRTNGVFRTLDANYGNHARRPAMTDIFDRADEIYAGLTVVATTSNPGARVGVAEILRFLTDALFALSDAQMAKLQTVVSLRDTYDRLARDLSVATIPSLAAAADSEDTADQSQPVIRYFDGGRLLLRPAPHPGVFYFRVSWDNGRPPGSSLVLHLTSDALPIGRLALPSQDADGTINELLNERVPAQRAIIHAIYEPRSQGHILPQDIDPEDKDVISD